MTPTLSIVVITRNERAYIEACLRAAVAAGSRIDLCEIALIDSNSSDDTVEIASRFPIRIIRLSGAYRVCPAMGRHVGMRLTAGRYILFLDGDTTINPRWVELAIRVLDA